MDRLHKSISIFGAIITLFVISVYRFNDGKFYGEEIPFETFWLVAFTGLLALTIFLVFEDRLRQLVVDLKISRENLLRGVVIDYKRIEVNILDAEGLITNYKEEVFFKRIGELKDQYTSWLSVDGKIESSETRTKNCTIIENAAKNYLRVSYRKQKADPINRIFDQKLYYGFSTQIDNCFPAKDESWGLELDSLTNRFELVFTFPHSRIPRNFRVVAIEKDKSEVELLDHKALLSIRDSKYKLSLNLFHLDTKRNYDVRWSW